MMSEAILLCMGGIFMWFFVYVIHFILYGQKDDYYERQRQNKR